ncbi:hypothetical protein [Halalkalicoccus jeotgali]|uniref:DUF8160 domain-containing protein n=1 Tax=Halalkalicoccus jeotgali (strain DSM 18796 / CECT 7217 / JCM 14584 / KCTC 4019 / B3) TaxID=795797 RepID=D8JB82_HALJB|nr:hypothetical protein [Halalkalicoccus jeotgali]ADJ16535.1 hypothetical protein HacjB3_15876 [Halalkalicoccus jeotgali B3]ELY41370.1 hypothetical protein C497_01380 [Halalkalicoccus jeotgali B3]
MSDGWGDASGIEGNYEEDPPDGDVNKGSGTQETNAPTGTQSTNETSATKTNIKDEWNGRTIYIPDDVLDAMEDTYLESQLKLRKAGQNEFKKNRHFYPLLVQFGLEALSDADVEDIRARLSEISDD